jgi:hypothetical protein
MMPLFPGGDRWGEPDRRPVIGAVAAAALWLAIPAVAATPAAEPVWLIVAASDPAATAIAHKAKSLASTLPRALIVQTRDCGDKKNVFAIAAKIADSAEDAKAALPAVRNLVKDAYVKKCAVVAGSLLSLRFPAVDASIADVPDSAVNWDEEDRVSTTAALPHNGALVVARYFVNDPEDPLEGRRERVIRPAAAGRTGGKTLADDCPGAGGFTESQGRIAFECGSEQAADQMLHNVLVFDAGGAKLADVSRCRKPRFAAPDALTCSEESVNASGKLKLRPKKVSLPRAATPGAP